jgi:HEAT repeat protein
MTERAARLRIGLGAGALMTAGAWLLLELRAEVDGLGPAPGLSAAGTPEASAAGSAPAGARLDAALVVRTPAELRRFVRLAGAADASAAPELRRLALESPDPLVSGNAIRALGRLGRAGPADGLGALLADPRPRVRQEAVVALGASRDPAAVPLLEPLARDAADPTLRALALQALGRIGDQRARRHRESVLQDPRANETDRAFAKAALRSPSR